MDTETIRHGVGHATKSDEFPENFQGEGGPFSIPKFIMQILDPYIGGLTDVFGGKKCIIISEYEGGGQIINPIW